MDECELHHSSYYEYHSYHAQTINTETIYIPSISKGANLPNKYAGADAMIKINQCGLIIASTLSCFLIKRISSMWDRIDGKSWKKIRGEFND